MLNGIRQPPIFPGSHPPSIVGRLRLNRRVRYGNGCFPKTHRHRKFPTVIYWQRRKLFMTRRGIEPLLQPWKGRVLTAWPTGHECCADYVSDIYIILLRLICQQLFWKKYMFFSLANRHYWFHNKINAKYSFFNGYHKLDCTFVNLFADMFLYSTNIPLV